MNQPEIELDLRENVVEYGPGVYDIDIEDYHKSEGISRSGIMMFKKSPLHYFSKDAKYRDLKTEADAQTTATIFGNLVHAYLLEPETFAERYMVAEKPNRASNAGKQAWLDIQKRAGTRTVVYQDMFDEVKRMCSAVLREPIVKKLIEGAKIEKSIFWRDKKTNILCKARPDIWHSNMICDIKTAADASPKEFQRSMVNYGYHIQAAMIKDGIKAVCDKVIDEYIFIVIEKVVPYAVGVYILDSEAVSQGQQEYRKILEDYKKYEKSHDGNETRWPGYKPTIISLPAYYNPN